MVRIADYRDIRAAGTNCARGGKAMSAANLVELILAIGLTVFLIIALIFPERF
jgi:K+-transporting ATPase KdpF subunit